MVFHNSLFLPEGNPNSINVRSFLNIQSCSVLFEYNQHKPSLYNDLTRKATSCPVLRWRKTTQSDLKITLTVCLENSRVLSPFRLPPGPCLHGQQNLGSCLLGASHMQSLLRLKRILLMASARGGIWWIHDGLCWEKDTSCFRGELLHSFLPDSSEGLSFPWLIAPVPFGKGEFVSLTVPQWQRLILDVTGAWCSRVRNKEARSEHVFSQGSSSFVAGRWRRPAQCCCFSDLQLALGTVLTREHVETEETSLSSAYSSVCSLQGGFSAWLWEDLLGT